MNIFDLDTPYLNRLVQDAWEQVPSTLMPIDCLGPTYVALRKSGRLVCDFWKQDTDLSQVFLNVLAEFYQQQPARQFDSIEVCLTYDYCVIAPENLVKTFSNIHLGVRGIELQYQGYQSRYSPTRMIAANRTFVKVITNFLEEISVPIETFGAEGGTIRSFDARQFLVIIDRSVSAVALHRGSQLVSDQACTGPLLVEMAHSMGQWLLNQVHSSGRITYKYWPSRGEESKANNMIRQFMANVCLIRYAQFTGRAEHLEIASRSLDYNLDSFFQRSSDIGFIVYQGKAKLGAAALATLAILEHPNREKYADNFQLLCAGIESLWSPDGSFRTFYQPVDRNDNQNFYPGEALLFWAFWYAASRDANVLQRCLQSFAYYRQWHRQYRNPAFIPWHTQAYSLLYQLTGERELRDFVFEMNDWLLSMQQWDGTQYPDIQGRFYDPDRPQYGPPHASSTGVYLEGLADAYVLAKDALDQSRMDSYQQAIWRGVRSIRQLQFKDKVDMFYISKRNQVIGGLRTTVYDNTIRVDNVQHCLMAILKLCRLESFMLTESFESKSSSLRTSEL